MPKFKLSTKVQAKDMFQSMNVSRVFSQQAELGRISDDTPLGKLYLISPLHYGKLVGQK